MNRKQLSIFALVAVLAIAIPAAAFAGKVTMSGSTSVYPLAVKLAKKYNKVSKGKTKFTIVQGGSDIGVADAAAGRVSIGFASRDPKPGDPGGLKFHKFAKDAVCIVTNPANRVSNMSKATIQSIFLGQIKNWSDVPGAGTTGPISINVRTAASGTQDAFKNIFMDQKNVTGTAAQKNSNGLVQQAVKSNKGAIGYVSLDFVKGTNVVGYNGVTCNLRNAKSGKYGGVRNFWMVTKGAPKGDTKAFINWSKKSAAARRIIDTDWVPLR